MEANGDRPRVKISYDKLEARISIPHPVSEDRGTRYSKENFIELLNASGVTFGINLEAVATLAEHPVYSRDVIVALGKPMKPGTPGYYEEHFDLSVNKKPSIREDGTTDYMNIKLIEMVHKGDEIMTYHPAVQGSRGMTVTGVIIEPKPVRDLPPVPGRGFDRSEDGIHYVAQYDGKIEKNGNRLIISKVYEINSDVDIAMGNVYFNGDIIVHGGVGGGAIVKASGNITIDGTIDNCEIYAGKDLFLKSGVKGGTKTIVDADGTITAQFFEYANVHCKGNIVADYVFNSRIICDGTISLTGNKAAIIGGYVSAVQGIEANEIGNDFGTNTEVCVGAPPERIAEANTLTAKIEALNSDLEKIKKGLSVFEEIEKAKGLDLKNDPRRLQLLRVKIKDEAIILENKTELEKLNTILARGYGATIKVLDTAYAGTIVSIDDHRVTVREPYKKIQFVKTEDGVKMELLQKLH